MRLTPQQMAAMGAKKKKVGSALVPSPPKLGRLQKIAEYAAKPLGTMPPMKSFPG